MSHRNAFVIAVLTLSSLAAAEIPEAPHWTRITPENDSKTGEIALVRTRDGVLHAAWKRSRGERLDLMHTAIGTNGSVTGVPVEIASGWSSLTVPALLLQPDGSLRAFFGGKLGSTEGRANPFNAGALYIAKAPASGSAWTLEHGRFSTSSEVWAGTLGAAPDTNSVPVVAWSTGKSLDFQIGANEKESPRHLEKTCCHTQAALAVDGETGEVVMGWYANDHAEFGLYTRQITPKLTPPMLVPGSVQNYNGKAAVRFLDQQLPISGRIGAPGVYVAHCDGNRVNLWRVGSENVAELASVGGDCAAYVAAGPEGRLWVFWSDNGRYYAARSNRAAMAFASRLEVPPPSGAVATHRIKAEGSAGPLDAFVHVSETGGAVSTWHTRVMPELEVSVNRRTVSAAKGGRLSFVVTDVGDPVKDVVVSARGVKVTTDADGKATLGLGPGKAGTIVVTVSRPDYAKVVIPVTAVNTVAANK